MQKANTESLNRPDALNPSPPPTPASPSSPPADTPASGPQPPMPPQQAGAEVFLRQTHARLGDEVTQTQRAVADEAQVHREQARRAKFGPRMSPYNFD